MAILLPEDASPTARPPSSKQASVAAAAVVTNTGVELESVLPSANSVEVDDVPRVAAIGVACIGEAVGVVGADDGVADVA